MKVFILTTKDAAKEITSDQVVELLERDAIDRDRLENPEDYEDQTEEEIYTPDIGRHMEILGYISDTEHDEVELLSGETVSWA